MRPLAPIAGQEAVRKRARCFIHNCVWAEIGYGFALRKGAAGPATEPLDAWSPYCAAS